MKRLIPVFLLAECLLVMACATPPALPPQPWTDTELPSGIRIQVRPAAREDLVQRFGRPSVSMNPFLDYPAILSSQSILVFDVRIDSPEYRIELVSRKTTILFENAKPGFLSPAEARALDAEGLKDAWMLYIDGTSKVSEAEQKAKEALPKHLTAAPGSPASGYLVFLHAFPKYGIATLSLTLQAVNGDEGAVKMRVEIPDPEGTQKGPGIFTQAENN